MTRIASEELARMRTQLEDSLPDTCVIHSNAGTQAASGYKTSSFGASGTVACRLSPVNRREALEAIEGDKSGASEYFILTVPHGTTLTEKNRVVVSGTTFDVIMAPTPRSYSLCRTATVTRIV
jgi:hypothetical protein